MTFNTLFIGGCGEEIVLLLILNCDPDGVPVDVRILFGGINNACS